MDQNSELVLNAVNVAKAYGKAPNQYHALKQVSLQVRRGDCISIVGKSGSGKSTLMHILALLDTPTQGMVEVEGERASGLSKRNLDRIRNQSFGFVFQQFFLNPRRSVLDNVALPLTIRGVSVKEREAEAMAALQKVGMEALARKKANDLSGGEKQRVVIARAIVGKPSIIFADEPTGNLDSVTGGMVENLLFELNRELGITLLVVTHDQDLASRCPKSIELRDGEILSSRGMA